MKIGPSSGSRGVPCGQRDGRTDMTKLIVTFHNFAKAPKNGLSPIFSKCLYFSIHKVEYNYRTNSMTVIPS